MWCPTQAPLTINSIRTLRLALGLFYFAPRGNASPVVGGTHDAPSVHAAAAAAAAAAAFASAESCRTGVHDKPLLEVEKLLYSQEQRAEFDLLLLLLLSLPELSLPVPAMVFHRL